MPPRKRLGQLLTELHVVDEHQLQSALGHQKQWGGKLGGILVQKGFCKEEQVVNALATHLGMPVVKLATQQVDPRAVKLVTRQIAEKLHVFAYEITGVGRTEVVAVAMSDPTDLSAVDQLAFHTGKRIKPMLCGDSEIVNAIVNNYGEGHPPAPAPVKPAAAPAPAASQPSATPTFPRRIEPLPPRAPSAWVATPMPARITKPSPPLVEPEPVKPPAPANIEPATPPQQAESLALPDSDEAADGPMEGLEPIAAHTQAPGEEVSGQEEVAGDGSAADALEGLEAASEATRHEGAEQPPQAPIEGGEPLPEAASWNSAASAASTEWGTGPATGWDAAPAAEDAPPADGGWGEPGPAEAGWGESAKVAAPGEPGEAQEWGATSDAPDAAQRGWGPGEQAAAEPGAATEESFSEELPADAIIGTADALEGGADGWALDAPTGEHGFAEEEPANEHAGEEHGAPEGDPAQEDHALEEHGAAQAEPAQGHDFAEQGAAQPEPAHEEHGGAPLAAPDPPAAGQHESEAPDAWASSDDPLAAVQEPAVAPGEPAAQEPAMAWGEPAAQEPTAVDEHASGEPHDGRAAEMPEPDAWPAAERQGDEASAQESAGEGAGDQGPAGWAEAADGEHASHELIPPHESVPPHESIPLSGEPSGDEPAAIAGDAAIEGEGTAGAHADLGEPARARTADQDGAAYQDAAVDGDQARKDEQPGEEPPAGEPLAVDHGADDRPVLASGLAEGDAGAAEAPWAADQPALEEHDQEQQRPSDPDDGPGHAPAHPHGSAEEDGFAGPGSAAPEAVGEEMVFEDEGAAHEHAAREDSATWAPRDASAEEPGVVAGEEGAQEAVAAQEDAAASEGWPPDDGPGAPEALGEAGTEESPLDGWGAPSQEAPAPGAAAGEALAATTLSPADLDTLAAVGVDVNDGVGAFRLLAAVLRVLQRQNAIDFDELAHELEQSRAAALAADEPPQPPPEEAL